MSDDIKYTEICIDSYILIQNSVFVKRYFNFLPESEKDMETYDIIKQLCDENGIKLSVLASGIGVRNSVFTELKMGRTKKLSVSTLEKIAAYFSVPLSLLTGEDDPTDSKQNELFRKRKLLFDLSARASEEDLDKILRIVDALISE